MTMAMPGWQRLPGRGRMRGMTTSLNPYRGFRFPREVIQHVGGSITALV
jgi:hypothetical protein